MMIFKGHHFFQERLPPSLKDGLKTDVTVLVDSLSENANTMHIRDKGKPTVDTKCLTLHIRDKGNATVDTKYLVLREIGVVIWIN